MKHSIHLAAIALLTTLLVTSCDTFSAPADPDKNTEQASTDILFPITNGERNIVITHSPGCGSNTYTYVFKKISEN